MPVPGQEFSDAASRVVGDAEEQVSEIVLRVEAVELGVLDIAEGLGELRLAGELSHGGIWVYVFHRRLVAMATTDVVL